MSRAGKFKSFPYSAALLVSAVTIAAAMAGLLGFEWNQRQALLDQANRRVDSVTAPAFLLDREFLRFTSALEGFLNTRTPLSLEALRIRVDVLSSKVDVVRNSPGSEVLLQNPQVAHAVNQIVSFANRADGALSGPVIDRQGLHTLRAEVQAFSAESLALGNTADLLGSTLLEEQSRSLVNQNWQITWLTLGQLVLLVLVAGSLFWRGKVQHQEQKALSELNHALQKAQEQAVSANLGKSIFLANMSHELRTPFNGVMGLLSLLKSSHLTPEQEELVTIANDSASHLLQLLNDILDMSALEQGKISLHMERVHLPQLLAQVAATFKPLAAQKKLRFEIQHALPPDCWIETDPTRLRQILFNLISNAIKFTERGHVLTSARLNTAQADAVYLEIQVQDSGIGMSEEALGKLFQRFFQADAGLSRKFAGVGLGLQISLSLARCMGGDITVQSQLLHGSMFAMRLPVCLRSSPLASTPVATPPTSHERSNERSHGWSHHAVRILVAEDHAVNQKYMALLLARLGYEATFCDNGVSALAALAQARFDMVLMDIHMPVMDGLSTTRAIRALPAPHSTTPIIALTADVLQAARDQAQDAGVDAFIAKPVKQAELEQAILNVLARARDGVVA